jgi:large exoprotein involved in heme utilization and adhesion
MSDSAPGASVSLSAKNIDLKQTSIGTTSVSSANSSNISLTASAGNIVIEENSTVNAEAKGGGKSGDIFVDAGNIVIANGSRVSSSAAVLGTGTTSSAGSLTLLAAESLSLKGDIKSENGDGKSGTITITTPKLVISEYGRITSTTRGSGEGGTITIDAGTVDMSNKSSISSASTSTGTAGDIELKNAVNIKLVDSSITTETSKADGGNIIIDPVLVYLNNSDITTSVKGGTGNGGNINLTSNQLLLVSSMIRAQAYGGKGGDITLNADVIIKSPIGSLISASSNLGIHGNVVLSSPVLDVNAALVEMPSTVRDINALTPRRCIANGDDISSFVVYACGASSRQPDAAIIGK